MEVRPEQASPQFARPRKLAERVGFEPAAAPAEAVGGEAGCGNANPGLSQTMPEAAGPGGPELAEIVAAWPTLAVSTRAALLTLVRAVRGGGR